MANQQPSQQTFANDDIMTHILRMLGRQDQYQLQKVCRRLRFLVITCVWKRDWKQMHMQLDQEVNLTDREFVECLDLNADNVEKLTIYAADGKDFLKYFPRCFENLMELHLKGFRSTCEWKSLAKVLQKLKNLKVLIMTNFVGIMSYDDLRVLATKVALERLELYNVDVSASESHLPKDLDLPDLKVLKIHCSSSCRKTGYCLKFAEICPNLQELKLILHNKVNGEFFDKFKHLERINVMNPYSAPTTWSLMRRSNLRGLQLLIRDFQLEHNFEISGNEVESCGNIEFLLVTHQTKSVKADHFWSAVFQSPLTGFNNLTKLSLMLVAVSDSFMQLISVKCTELKSLNLIWCQISGKYVNHMLNLRDLRLSTNGRCITWSSLCCILHDLTLLEHFTLHNVALAKNEEFVDTSSLQNMCRTALKALEISILDGNYEFWDFISKNCKESFQNVHTLCIKDYGSSAHDLRGFFAIFKQLYTLHINGTDKVFVTTEMIPTVKNLTLSNCGQLEWMDMIEKLSGLDLETLQIFGEIGYNREVCRHNTSRGFFNWKKLRAITIPYKVFQPTSEYWRQHLAESPKFQFSCICKDGSERHKVLSLLMLNSPFHRIASPKERVKAVHLNICLRIGTTWLKDQEIDTFSKLRNYCKENLHLSNIPVCYLDEANERLWNSSYEYNYVAIIEV